MYVLYVLYVPTGHYYQPWMLSALCGAMTVVYGSLLRFLSTCGCLQGRVLFQSNGICGRFKTATEYCGGQVLSFFVLLSFALLLASVVMCWLTDVKFSIFLVLLQSKVWSQVEWFFWAAPFFSFRYPIDRRYFYQRLLPRESSGSKNNDNNNLEAKV